MFFGAKLVDDALKVLVFCVASDLHIPAFSHLVPATLSISIFLYECNRCVGFASLSLYSTRCGEKFLVRKPRKAALGCVPDWVDVQSLCVAHRVGQRD